MKVHKEWPLMYDVLKKINWGGGSKESSTNCRPWQGNLIVWQMYDTTFLKAVGINAADQSNLGNNLIQKELYQSTVF